MWDCHNMFALLDGYNSTISELLDFDKLAFYNHISYSYVFFAFLNKALFGTAILGQMLYSKILIVVSGVGIYKLLQIMYPKAGKTEYLMISMIWLGSPFVMGLSSYSYNDFATWCIFPILLYFLYSKKDIYAFLTAFYFVFCKESSVVMYSFLLLGIYVVEAWEKRKVIHSIERFFVLLLPCFLWLFSYYNISHWDGGGGLILSIEYFIAKLKSFYCINFNWLLGILGVFCVVEAFRNRYKQYLGKIVPIVFSGIVYIVFSGIINTGVNHQRYIDALYAEIYILASFFPLVLVTKKKIKIVTYILSLSVSILSSFYTLDPISRAVYQEIDVGRTSVITSGQILSDAMVYNRQYQNYGYIVDEAIADIMDSPNGIIYMPALYNNPWYFDAMGTYIIIEDDAEIVITEQWNTRHQTRMTDTNLDENIPFEIHVISNNYRISMPDGTYGYYLYTSYAGIEMANYIRNNFNIVSDQIYSKSGWDLHCLTFTNTN